MAVNNDVINFFCTGNAVDENFFVLIFPISCSRKEAGVRYKSAEMKFPFWKAENRVDY